MEELKKILREADIKQTDLLKALNLKSLSTINLKLNGKNDFTTKEAIIIRDLINNKLGTTYCLEELFDPLN